MDWSRGRSRWMLGTGAFLAFALLLGLVPSLALIGVFP